MHEWYVTHPARRANLAVAADPDPRCRRIITALADLRVRRALN